MRMLRSSARGKILAALLVLVGATLLLWRGVAHPTGGSPFQVVSLRTTAGGYMLDMRYRVTDPERAAALFGPKVHAELVHESTGARLGVPSSPKVGPLRQRSEHYDPAKTYFVIFANPAAFVKSGDRMSLRLGEHVLPGLIVR